MKAQHLLIFLLAALSAAVSTAQFVGGWSPVNVNDQRVQSVAQFAVAEHNRQTGDVLVYVSVSRGESQVVAGTNYRLYIVARRDISQSAGATYEALVFDQPWTSTRQLRSFTRVN